MIIFYHLLVFSDFILDLQVKFQMGYSLLGFMGLLIALNISVSLLSQASRVMRKIRWKNRKEKYEERLLEIDRQRNPEKYLTEADHKFLSFRQEMTVNNISKKYGLERDEVAIIVREEFKNQTV